MAGKPWEKEIVCGEIKGGIMDREECDLKTKNELQRKRKITVMKESNGHGSLLETVEGVKVYSYFQNE
jgi:hypothetical protein